MTAGELEMRLKHKATENHKKIPFMSMDRSIINMFLSILLLALHLFIRVTTSQHDNAASITIIRDSVRSNRDGILVRHGHEDGPCYESFPLLASSSTASSLTPPSAPPDETQGPPTNDNQQRQLVAIPEDETGRSYAPLCDDGRHIDVRRLTQCNGGSCFSNDYQVRAKR